LKRLCLALLPALLALASAAAGAPDQLIGNDDFPVAELTAGHHGSTIVAYDIAPIGYVEHCRVLRSSGYPALDKAACNILYRRATYPVTQDKRGPRTIAAGATFHWIVMHTPVTATDLPIDPKDVMVLFDPSLAARNPGQVQVIAPVQQPWRQPSKYPKRERKAQIGGRTYIMVLVNRSGAIEDCSVIRSSGNQELDNATCAFATESIHYKPALDSNKKPMFALDHIYIDWVPPRP
jgi:TonB family protein